MPPVVLNSASSYTMLTAATLVAVLVGYCNSTDDVDVQLNGKPIVYVPQSGSATGSGDPLAFYIHSLKIPLKAGDLLTSVGVGQACTFYFA